MELQRMETMHNTPEQVALYLDAALELVASRELPAGSEGEVIVGVVNLLAAKTINVVQQAPMPIGLPTMAIPRGRH